MTLFAARHFIPRRMTYSMLSLAADRMKAISPYRPIVGSRRKLVHPNATCIPTMASLLHFPSPDRILLTSHIS
jgi:hypothetical protein